MCGAGYKAHLAGTAQVPAELCLRLPPHPARVGVRPRGSCQHRQALCKLELLQPGQSWARKGSHCSPSQLGSYTPEGALVAGQQVFLKECGWPQPTRSLYKSSHFNAVSLQTTTTSLLHRGIMFSFDLNIPLRSSLLPLYNDNRTSFLSW